MQDWQVAEQTAEERFRLLMMNMPDVVWTTDQEGRTTFISPNVAQVYGFTPEEIYRSGGRLWLDRIHPDDLGRVKEAYELLFSRDQSYDVQYRIQCKDGCWIWVHDRAVTTYQKGGLAYADGLFTDITEWVGTQEALHRERDFISAVLDTAGALVVVLDRVGRIVRFNRACERTTGYSFDEVKGRLLWDLFLLSDEVAAVKSVFRELQAGQFPSEYENHWLTKGGDRRLIAWSNTALVGADGAVEYVIGTGIDVTERREAESQRDATLEELTHAHQALELRVARRTAELQRANENLQEEIAERGQAQEALRQSESHMRSLMESARTYAVYRVAVDPANPFLGRVVLASPSMKELLSVPDLSDFSTWFTTIHPDDLGRVVEANRRSLETGVPFDQQFRVLHKDRGESAWVHVRSTPVVDADGRLTHFNGLVVDITEQKRAEEEIRRQNEYLAALHETALGVLSRLDTADLLEALVERAVQLAGATYGFVYLVRPGSDEIEVRVGTGPYRAYVGRRLKKGEGLSGTIWQSGQPLALEDYQSWSGRSGQFEGVPFGPAMGTPLLSGAEVVGVIGVARPDSAPPFRREEMDLIHRFSHLASIALDNARLHTSMQEELAERVRAEETLQAMVEFEDAIARISGSFVNLAPEGVDDGIQQALGTIGKAHRLERACVFQFSGDRTRMDCTHEWCGEGVEPHIHRMKDVPIGALGWTVEQIMRLEVVQIPDASLLPPGASAERVELESVGMRSRIVVPMAYRGAPVGFVGFDARRARAWTEQSLKLQVIGDILVNALEHRRAQAIQTGQRQFLELLATGGTFAETLHTLVRVIEEQWPGMLGLILLLDDDGVHLHIGASVSLPEDYIQSIEGLEIGPMVGSCGTACYRRERVIVEDTATDPRWEGLRDLALQHGLRACWSEPVFSPDGRVVGTFAMYYRQPRSPTEGELRAIEMGAHLVGVAIEHRRAEEALRESEAKFRGIIEYAIVGIAIVQGARFRFVNPHWASMLGYTVEELVGTEFMGYCVPEERDRIVDFYTRRLRGEPVPARYETAMIHKDGGRVYVDVSVGLIPYDGQQATFVSLRDITEQKRARQALEEAYQTLEQRVKERTKELAALNAISAVVSRSLDLKEIMASALESTMEVMQLEMGAAYRAARGDDPDGVSLRLVAHAGLSDKVVRAAGSMPLRNSLVERAASTGQPYVWRVAQVPLQAGLGEAFREEGLQVAVSIPLTAKGQVVGGMHLGTRHAKAVTSEGLSLLAAIGQQVGMAVENARLYEAEQERRGEAEGRRRVAEGMREILAVLNSRQSLQETLDFIASQTCDLLGSDAAAILHLEGDLLRIQASCGLDAEEVPQILVPLGTAAAGRALAQRRPVIVPDASAPVAPERRDEIPPEPYWTPLQRLVSAYRAVLSVPLIIQDEAYGAISLYYGALHDFSDEEIRLAVGVSDQVALAIENARLREQAGQSAALEERGRLARELHDSVTQSLYSVTMYTEAAARLMTAGQETDAAECLRDARDTAKEALREMRLMIYQLRPPLLEKGGLAVALQVRLDAVERRGGIHAELIVEGEDRLPPHTQAELHQIAQEALNNALKHAHAQSVQVRLGFGGAATCLEVQDDGVGFDPAAAREGGGMGLPGMKERVQRIGGRLDIESAPGRGTRVSVEVPTGGDK